MKTSRILLCLVLSLSVACDKSQQNTTKSKDKPTTTKTADKTTTKAPKKTPPTTPKTNTPKGFVDMTAKAVASKRKEVKFFSERAKKTPTSWLDLEKVAQAHLALANLTGNVQHYKDAQVALNKALAMDPKSGPFLTKASYDYAVHDIKSVQKYLDKFKKKLLLSDIDKRIILSMESDLAYHNGNLPKALEGYKTLIKQKPNATNISKLGLYYKTTGQLDLARKTYDDAIQKAAKSNNPQLHAWTYLMRGIVELDSGKLDPALAYFNKANKTFSGWYLIREHLAEVHASKGLLKPAEKMYLQVLEGTPNGEFMDALADVYGALKQTKNEQKWRSKAKVAYERNLKILPSSAYGHALDHYLTTDKDKALTLAKANHTMRPGMAARLKLAQAHMLHGQTKEAKALIETILKSPYSTAELHGTASVLYAKLGKADKAKTQKEKAIALHPEVMGDLDWLQ